jgi:hypothetical protein
VWNRTALAELVQWIEPSIEPWASGRDLIGRGCLKEAPMTGWRDQMVDRPETDNAVYAAGWTVSGLAVLGAIVAVWVLGF